jgi:hypothetical protein
MYRLADRLRVREAARNHKLVSWKIFQQVLLKRIGKMTYVPGRSGKNVSNAPALLSDLGLSTIGPSRRTAHKRYELTPSQSIAPYKPSDLQDIALAAISQRVYEPSHN